MPSSCTKRISGFPKASLVVINWNQAGFVEDTIKSIRQQNYPHFECLVIDNASTDDSRSVIAASIKGDPRIRPLFLDENLDQMGAFLHVLDKLRGPLVAVIDADDILLPSYLSAHAQIHLCCEIGLSSSRTLEISGDGSIQTGTHDAFGGNDLGLSRGIPIGPGIKRISSLSSDQFSALLANSIQINEDAEKWQWSPGSANVYRKEVLQLARPVHVDRIYRAAVDNYFVPFCNALASSILIDVPLSAYRIHGGKRHAMTNSMSGLRTISRTGEKRSADRRRDIILTLCNRPEAFLRVCDEHKFWRLMDLPSKIDRQSKRACYESQPVRDTLRSNFHKLSDVLGKDRFEIELRKRMSAEAFQSLLEDVSAMR